MTGARNTCPRPPDGRLSARPDRRRSRLPPYHPYSEVVWTFIPGQCWCIKWGEVDTLRPLT